MLFWGFPSRSAVKNPPAVQEKWVWSLGQEDPLERGHDNPLQYTCLQNPWIEEPGRLQSRGSQRLRHDWSEWAHTCTYSTLMLRYYHQLRFLSPPRLNSFFSSQAKLGFSPPQRSLPWYPMGHIPDFILLGPPSTPLGDFLWRLHLCWVCPPALHCIPSAPALTCSIKIELLFHESILPIILITSFTKLGFKVLYIVNFHLIFKVYNSMKK